jgi:signal peptide peptidase SppA
MRVLGFLETSFWTMRQQEFASMMRVAYTHAGELDGVLDRIPKHEAMMAKTGSRLDGTRYVEMRGDVAVIDVNGIIAKRMDMFDEICSGGTSTEKLMKDLQTCLDDPKIKAIVFNIDSPGGEAFGINELSQAIYTGRGKKPIHAYVSGLGCSGAYWIATAADDVTVDRSAFVGSIGVVTAWTDDKEFYQMLGIRREVVTSTNAPFKRLDFDNEEHRAEMQRELDSIENVFIKAVARNRKTTVDKVKSDFNQGGVLLGTDAVKAGMADNVGSLEEVIKNASRQAKTTASFGAFKNGEINMSLSDKIKAFFASDEILPLLDANKEYAVIERPVVEQDPAAAPAEEPAQEPEAPATPPVTEPKTAPIDPDAAPERDPAQEAEALHLRAATAEAESFMTTAIQAGRMTPAEKPAFLSLYAQAAADDRLSPLATGSRVESLKASYTVRKASGLTEEVVDAEANQVILASISGSGSGNGSVSADRQRELLESSPLGKSALKLVDKASAGK